MSIYVTTTAEQLSVGDRIKLVETYESAIVTYEGAVHSKPNGTLVDISVDSNGGYTTAYGESQHQHGRSIKVDIWNVVDLPTVAGSIIELHDRERMASVRAILSADGYWLQLFVGGDVSTAMLDSDSVAAEFERVIFVP